MKLIDASLPWYVVTCRTGAEERCWLELRTGGLDAYFPRRRRKVFNRRMRILRTVEDAALPGYVFLAGSIDWGRLHDDRHFEHVGRPLRGSDGPLCIPGRIVEQISIDEMAGAFDLTGATRKANLQKLRERFPKGRPVKIVGEGAFRDFAAVVEAVTAKERIKALVNILGRHVPVEFGAEELDAA